MTAILFGSISTIADTSELQRESFNQAFAQHGLDWQWSRQDYLAMLELNGGRERVAAYAEERGQDVDAAAVHRTKSELFQQNLAGSTITPRPGVAETIRDARQNGIKVALVTTTSKENVAALAEAVSSHFSTDDLDLIVDSSQVEKTKPDPEAYAYALGRLGETVRSAVAVEDNVGGVAAATAAGLACVAFPNANTAEHDFAEAVERRERLDLADLSGFIPAG